MKPRFERDDRATLKKIVNITKESNELKTRKDYIKLSNGDEQSRNDYLRVSRLFRKG